MEVIENRKVIQEPIYVENGNKKTIIGYTIPGYIQREKFLEDSERKFLGVLINIISEMNRNGYHLQISTQVAINRIIKINEERNKQYLTGYIQDKSIDYVIFDLNTSKVKCCIELNGKEHYEDENIKTKDFLKKEIIESTGIKFFHINKDNYNKEQIEEYIKSSL